jgi:hypothetical protein
MPAKGKVEKTATPRIWSEDELRSVMLGKHSSSNNGLRWYETKHELERLTNDDLDMLLQSSPATASAYHYFFSLTINRLTSACSKGGEFCGKKPLVQEALARKTRLREMKEFMMNKKHPKIVQPKKALFHQGRICS